MRCPAQVYSYEYRTVPDCTHVSYCHTVLVLVHLRYPYLYEYEYKYHQSYHINPKLSVRPSVRPSVRNP